MSGLAKLGSPGDCCATCCGLDWALASSKWRFSSFNACSLPLGNVDDKGRVLVGESGWGIVVESREGGTAVFVLECDECERPDLEGEVMELDVLFLFRVTGGLP